MNDTLEATAGAIDGHFNGTAALESTIVRSGAKSAKFTGSSTQSIQWSGAATVASTNYYFRGYLYVPTGGLPASEIEIMGLGPGGFFYAIRLEPDGTLTLWANQGGGTWTQQGSASAAITLDAWNRVELQGLWGVGSVDTCEGKLEGSSFASATGLNVVDSTSALSFIIGNNFSSGAAVASTYYFDDLAVNDSTGAAQNTWPGSGKIVLLSPISDSAVGTGWTLGTGTAIAGNTGSTAVKNKPPLGVADLAVGSDTKQIRNATSNANVNYDANLTTYTNAGVGAADTINVLVPIVATAAPVATSAKAGTIGISSNPVIANVALGAGGTAGAFWSGVAGGTYATGWKWSLGTTTYAPTVTRANSPVARITQVTSSTRIAVVCAMGMYVDYTPAAVVAPAIRAEQALMRAAVW